MEVTKAPLVEMKSVSKDFFGNVVLKNINFALHEGEILGLVGENGAGKSTLMKILFGMEEIRETGGYGGQVLIDGKEVKFQSSLDALKYGIGMVHQEFSLLPDFTTTENILLNREPVKYSIVSEVFGDRMNTIDRKEMQVRALKAIERLGVDLDSSMLISQMPVGHKQFTEIARELSKEDDAGTPFRLLVLDEPTAVLSEKEAESLLKAMRALAKAGIAIIFITHRLQEIIDVCDTIMVMRDGEIIKSVPAQGCDVQAIANWMVGRQVSTKVQAEKQSFDYKNAEKTLSINHLWVNMPGEIVRDFSIDVYKGEILGIGGLAGQGKIGVPNGIMGLFPAGGTVTKDGKAIDITNPKNPLANAISFVSEDRRGVGLLLNESLEWNVTFTAMQIKNQFLKKTIGFIKFRDNEAIKAETEKYVDLLQIKCTSTKQKAKELSGGNQQKICLAKAFATAPDILFVSEPTRGIDIGAKTLVLNALRKYNEEQGTTIIMVSSELEELRSICDRIAIVSDGKVQGVLPATEASEKFGLLMVGHALKEAN